MKTFFHIVENVVQLPAKSPKILGKGSSQPLCAAVGADSLTKGFDAGMEEPVGETQVPEAGNKSRVLSDFSLAKSRVIIFTAGWAQSMDQVWHQQQYLCLLLKLWRATCEGKKTLNLSASVWGEAHPALQEWESALSR